MEKEGFFKVLQRPEGSEIKDIGAQRRPRGPSKISLMAGSRVQRDLTALSRNTRFLCPRARNLDHSRHCSNFPERTRIYRIAK